MGGILEFGLEFAGLAALMIGIRAAVEWVEHCFERSIEAEFGPQRYRDDGQL